MGLILGARGFVNLTVRGFFFFLHIGVDGVRSFVGSCGRMFDRLRLCLFLLNSRLRRKSALLFRLFIHHPSCSRRQES